ncbi:restriction endonuclease subunit S [Pantoea agglomerans]|uniref:restriction endonuclease subunit S n=1 Tax=Enterobacter agglomerans TaxID=549 RepID=UPI0028A0AC9D|nr:restriction endonuclease subunit S [Pantoea agglomerans]WNK53082.1 restriction endonuclease subunit S [Pantoea agglomerans]
MSFEWPVVQIDNIKANVKNAITIGPFGSRMKSDCYVESGVPVIRGTNLGPNSNFINGFVFITEDKADQLASCNVYKNDIVFPHRGSIGEVGIVENDKRYVLSSSLMKLTCDPHKACPKFIYYFFKSNTGRHELLKNASQVGTPGIGQPLSSLKSIELSLPPLKVQEKIAVILGDLDKKINLNWQMNQTLEQMAQALFKSWFVDFEPIKAKIAVLEAGGSQEDATLAAMTAISGKDSDGLVVFERKHPEQYAELKATAELLPSAMQDSELGEIPKKWTLSTIGAQVDIAGGATPSTKKPGFWDNGTIHWSTPKDLSNVKDRVLLYTERKITKSGLDKISSGLLPVNTVLMSSRAPVGYLAIAKVPVAINQGYIAMKCNKELSPEFVLQWCSANMPEIVSRASGTTFAEISKKNFNPIPLVKPQRELVKIYTKKTSEIYSLIENTMRENNSLTQLRDTLLPKLLSGEITLPEAEQAISEVENV